MTWFWTAALSMALAQDITDQGLDVHGSMLPPVQPLGPTFLWEPTGTPDGQLQLGLLLEAVNEPLRAVAEIDGELYQTVLVDDLFGANLSAAYGVSERFSLALSLPIWLGGTVDRLDGAGLQGGGLRSGDAFLYAPVQVLGGNAPLELAVVPHIGLPLGSPGGWTGDQGVQAGVLMSVGREFGKLAFTGNLGLDARPTLLWPNNSQPLQRLGGPGVVGGLGAGYGLGQYLAVHSELRFRSSLASQADTLDPEAAPWASPSELLLGLTGDTRKRTDWRIALAGGLNQAVGSPRGRLIAGFGYRLGKVDDELEPNIVADALTVAVLGVDGPVSGATLAQGSDAWTTDHRGEVLFGQGLRFRKPLVVTAAGYLAQNVESADGVKADRLEVSLVPAPVDLEIRVQDEQGAAVDAVVVATRGDEVRNGTTAELPRLEPGLWTLSIESDGFGGQGREVEVGVGAQNQDEIEVVLLPEEGAAVLEQRFQDANGTPIEGVVVQVDGRPVGTTGAGGYIRVEGLAPGEHALSAEHPAFTEAELDVALGEGENPFTTPLLRVAGSVRVAARTSDGRPVADAMARFIGPRRLAPSALGARGERVHVLGPGEWRLILTSETWGVQQRTVIIPEDSYDLIEVEFVMQPDEGGAAQLVVRVVDQNGRPVPGVEVLLDDRSLGESSTGGVVTVNNLMLGSRVLSVDSPWHVESTPTTVELVEGLQEQVLALNWIPGAVQVTARGPNGPVDDGTVRFIGPGGMRAESLDGFGRGLFKLDPGDWTVVVTSERYGLQQRNISIDGQPRLRKVDVVLDAAEGGLANLKLHVVDPDGNPVEGATLIMDGRTLGTTSEQFTELNELSVGQRVLNVDAPLYQPTTVDLRLLEGTQEEEVTLQWAPGAVRVEVEGPLGPVPDALVRMMGPGSVAPAPVDENGTQLFELTPGTWQAVATSTTLGFAQTTFVIEESPPPGLQTVRLKYAERDDGNAVLLVRAVDAITGFPVGNAEVYLDGKLMGTTPAGGALLLEELLPGASSVEVRSKAYDPLEPVRINLREGSQMRYFELKTRPGKLKVQAKDSDGKPVDAVVRLVGPTDHVPVPLGSDGTEVVELPPGTWQVVAQTDTLGPARTQVEVVRGKETRAQLVLETSRMVAASGTLRIKEQVLFDFNQAKLSADAQPVLAEITNFIVGHPDIVRVEVQGHSDSVGDLVYNQELSERRAREVRKALIEMGVAPEKLTARGYGAQRPVASNESEDGRAKNRRVEFAIVE